MLIHGWNEEHVAHLVSKFSFHRGKLQKHGAAVCRLTSWQPGERK